MRLAASRKWPDFEDCLIDICAEKTKADFLLTRNGQDFTRAHTRVLSPREFFDYLESEYRLYYDVMDLESED